MPGPDDGEQSHEAGHHTPRPQVGQRLEWDYYRPVHYGFFEEKHRRPIEKLNVQLPQKLSSPYPIFLLSQKFVQLLQLPQKFVQHGHGHNSPAAEEICAP